MTKQNTEGLTANLRAVANLMRRGMLEPVDAAADIEELATSIDLAIDTERERVLAECEPYDDEGRRRWFRPNPLATEPFTRLTLSRGECEWIVKACYDATEGDDAIHAITRLSADLNDLATPQESRQEGEG